MNVNIKVSLTDQERNLLKRKLTGKDVKAMVSRKEVNELVDGFMKAMLEDFEVEDDQRFDLSNDTIRPLQQFDQSKVPEQYRDKPLAWQMGWYRGRYVNKPFRV